MTEPAPVTKAKPATTPGGADRPGSRGGVSRPLRDKWKTLVALVAVLVAAVVDWNWPWGIIFVYWAAEALRDRQTYLVEDIGRDANPFLFWTIMCTWLASAGYLFLLDLDVVGPGAGGMP